MKVNWDDDISNIWKNKTYSKPPTSKVLNTLRDGIWWDKCANMPHSVLWFAIGRSLFPLGHATPSGYPWLISSLLTTGRNTCQIMPPTIILIIHDHSCRYLWPCAILDARPAFDVVFRGVEFTAPTQQLRFFWSHTLEQHTPLTAYSEFCDPPWPPDDSQIQQ